MFGKHKETDVVVVGAGPVGLMAALTLARSGVSVRIVDASYKVQHSYALALHAASLGLLAELGLADRLVGVGHRIERVAFYRDGEPTGTLDLAALPGAAPFVLVLSQAALQRQLEQALHERGVDVQWQHQLMDLTEAPDGVELRVARMERYSQGYPVARSEWLVAKELDLHPVYVVAADGYHSLARRKLSLAHEQAGEPERFTVFELACRVDFPHEMRVMFHEGTVNVAWPLGPQRARFSFQVRSEEEQPHSMETLLPLLRKRAPWFDAEVDKVLWATATEFERRLAAAFGRGRVWLAGDAAHITSPIGVQSMNVGLREAHDLAARIAAAIRGDGEPDALERYGAAGRREWRRLLGLEGRVAADAGAPNWARELAPSLPACIPASGADLDRLLAQVGLAFRP